MLEPGAKMPAFELMDQSGKIRTWKDIAGPEGLVLFAYPKDNTSG